MERHVVEIAAAPEFIYGFHLPWPSLGVVIPNGNKGCQWVAESHRWEFWGESG